MPYTEIMLHFIWATKNREPIITSELKPILLSHIKENSIKKKIFIDTLNCVSDHIHLLISLGTDQTISNIVKLIKGESSFWINNQKIIINKFEWQDDYMAYSVSKSAVDKVRQYIMNQEEHHKKQTFAQEYEIFLKNYGAEKK
jgi:putative transposase